MPETVDRNARKTKDRLLDAATALFADSGYRMTTVQEICRAAGANVAAVNYHFGSKEQLYVAVWEKLFGEAREFLHPEPSEADPPARLEEYVRRRVRHAFCEGDVASLRMIIHREMTNPSDVHDRLFRRFIEPVIRHLGELVAAVLDLPPDHIITRRCTFSIQSQLVFVAKARIKKHPMRHLFDRPRPSEQEIEALADHLVAFAVGGLRATADGPPAGRDPGTAHTERTGTHQQLCARRHRGQDRQRRVCDRQIGVP